MASSRSILADLDSEQRQAALALRGPVCILAGAGTGKTRTITYRIAHGVTTGIYSPQKVMALTFTSRAASELRTRLRELGASGVSARTFHSAALSQLGFFWPQLVGGVAPSVISGKGKLLGQAAELLHIRVDHETLRDVAAEIEWRKVNLLTPEQYELHSAERPRPAGLTYHQLIELQAMYEKLKDDRRQVDFEDVLLLTTGMLENEPRMALQVHEQYRHFVVDEYQDVSPLQQALLMAWVGDRQDLCVVGDASQTIYSFAGASSDYLLRFPSTYPEATVVRLEHNYRSSAPIVGAANSLMRSQPGALSLVPATDAQKTGPVPAVTVLADDRAEAEWVAAQIADRLAAGASARDIAVLCRLNVQTASVEAALSRRGVSYQVRGAGRFFDRPVVRQAIHALRAAALVGSTDPLFQTVSDVLRSLGWTQQPPEGIGATRDKWDALGALMSLADEAPPGTTVRAFSDELVERQKSQHEPSLDAVTIATIHTAKGLEWDIVFVLGVSEGLLPVSYAETVEDIAEERRLFYVAITRARRELQLSWARRGHRERQASRFLNDLAR
ncbi:ATP-dependent DNA helicase UvrD2 [Klugiella xanthotipulae]|uniref:DNA 3'-5' helicase n=1 Tax=Klugiella xanthotipulae TaxID=244735 RepID=A0A543HRR5_9MICO|nr:ATP-dependent helicase [Klugiella xanthotipulae]TQM61033.1 Rep family ATP-dependent DNA helicase [Klugiella xanthotipulae]